ncbi:MAG: phosphotransferase [Halioglobus sp.]
MIKIAATPEEITAGWLTTALKQSGHLEVGEVTAVEHNIIGTGKMGDNARLSLTYDGDYQAPKTLIAKLPATDETAKMMAGELGAYHHEVMFYRHLADRTAMATPKIYANEINDAGTEFVILMEDLAPAEPGSQLVGESLENARASLHQAAKLAATFYGDDSIGELDYVTSPSRSDGGAQGAALMEQCWPQFVDRFGHGLSKECLAFGERYVESHLHFVNRYTGPKTLVHGDFRCENLLYDSGSATVVDWQTVAQSSALTDAAYFLGGSVDIDKRREWERALIDDYSRNLAIDGVDLSLQDCWDQYREFSMHGIVITVLGAVFTAAEERSDKMFLTMIQRHLQQCVDLDSAEFLQ